MHKYGFWWGWDSQYPLLSMVSLYDTDSAIKVFRYTSAPSSKVNIQNKHMWFIWLLSLLALYECISISRDKNFMKSFYKDIKRMVETMISGCDERGMFPMWGTGADDPAQVGIKGGFDQVVVPDIQGLWYSVCRLTENAALFMKDNNLAVKMKEISQKLEDNYLKIFYDEKAGYLCVSADFKNGTRNRTFQNVVTMAMDGLYGPNLLFERIDRIADFIENDLAHPMLRAAVPFWNEAAEQWHSSIMLQHAAHESRTLRFAGKGKELMCWFKKYMHLFERKYVGIETLNLPDLLQGQVTQDRSWQAFGARGVYAAIIQSILGLEIDIGGITYIPCNTPLETTMKGLRLGSSTWDITITGKGRWVEHIKVDGKLIKGTLKIPSRFLNKKGLHELTIKRGNKYPSLITVLRAPWLEVETVLIKKDKAVFKLSGYARTPLWIFSPNPVKIFLNGSLLESKWYLEKKLIEAEVLVKRSNILKI